jgi:hypothetical protein
MATTCHVCGVYKATVKGRCQECGAMASRLTDLEIDEVSFVSRGANQGAHIEYFKSDDRVLLFKIDHGKRLGTALAELRRREVIAKEQERPGTWMEEQAELETAMRPDIDGAARYRFAKQVAAAVEADHAAYDEQYGLQTDPQAWATPHEEDES